MLAKSKKLNTIAVPSPEQTKWGDTSRKWKGALKYTELLRAKTDVQILHGYKYAKFKKFCIHV